jgi:plasmid stabilization system protein ParE
LSQVVKVVLTATFEQEVAAQAEYLAQHAPADWLDTFKVALEDLRTDLAALPETGASVKENEAIRVRMRSLSPRLPYIVYYAHRKERPIQEVRLLRLIHERQRRPRMTVPVL